MGARILMRELGEPVPALMICGLIFSDRDIFFEAVRELEVVFGPVEITSPLWEFTHTDYYCREMGSDLKRVFLAFSTLVPQDCLVEAKLSCRKIEENFLLAEHDSCSRKRQVNIDPGLLTPERLVLATGKNFTHRIYLGNGVFAETTLIATRSGFRTLEWTFPDYASHEILGFWNMVRGSYLKNLKKQGLI